MVIADRFAEVFEHEHEHEREHVLIARLRNRPLL